MESDWIKAKDKLPEDRQRVLFWASNKIVLATFLSVYSTEHTGYEKRNVFIQDGGVLHDYYDHEKVNYVWMELPNNPKISML